MENKWNEENIIGLKFKNYSNIYTTFISNTRPDYVDFQNEHGTWFRNNQTINGFIRNLNINGDYKVIGESIPTEINFPIFN